MDIELAQTAHSGKAAVREKRAELSVHRQEAFAVAVTVIVIAAGWVGSRMFYHLENWLFAAAGVGLLLLAAVIWRFRK